MGKIVKLIHNEKDFDTYKNVIERLRNQGYSYKDVGQRIGASAGFARNVYVAEDYNDYKQTMIYNSGNEYRKRKKAKEALAEARQLDKSGATYRFGERVKTEDTKFVESNVSVEKQYEQTLEDKAWELVLSDPTNKALRELAREISNREK